MDDSAPQTPFEVLNVPLDIDDAGIRRSYAALLRAARVAGDAGQAAKVQAAFETIRDEEPRQRLVKLLAEASGLAQPLEEADHLLSEGKLNEARSILKKLLQTSPRSEPVLSRLYQIDYLLRRFDFAATAAQRLIECAPSNHAYWVWRAGALQSLAEQTAEPERRERLLDTALKSVRKAKSLGADEARLQVLESNLLRSTGRQMAANKLLQARLAEARDLHSEELEAAITLLKHHAHQCEGRIFQGTLESIAKSLPENPERRDTIARQLCRLAASLTNSHPRAARECAGLAEICSPTNPEVIAFANECEEYAGTQEAVVEELARRSESPAAHSISRWTWLSWWTWFSWPRLGWPTIGLIVLIRIVHMGWNKGARIPELQPSRKPDFQVEADADGSVLEIRDSKGRKVPIEKLDTQRRKKKPKTGSDAKANPAGIVKPGNGE